MGAYQAYESFALIVSPDFSQRLSWTVFTGTGPSNGPVQAIAVGHGVVAFATGQTAADVTNGGALLTVDALQSAPPEGATSAFVALWSSP